VYAEPGVHTASVCTSDSAGSEACDTIQVDVSPMADVVLEMEESADPIVEGSKLTYELIVTNIEPEGVAGLTATNLVLTDELGGGVSFERVDASQGNCSYATGGITCQLGSLAPGASAAVTIHVATAESATAGTILMNHATVTHDQPDPWENSDVLETTTVVAEADLIVNTTDEMRDSAPGDGECATEDGACSLRAAIQEANAQPGVQTIGLSNQVYRLRIERTDEDESATGDLDITDDAIITGLGGTVLHGGEIDRVLDVHAGATVVINDVAIMGGKIGGPGGGLRNNGGSVTLNRVSLGSNSATNGGGLANLNGSVTLNQSAVTGNVAEDRGGGVHNTGSLFLTNVTLSGNRAQSGAGLDSSGPAMLTYVTVGSNTAEESGGGLREDGSTLTLVNTLVAGNTAASGPQCAGSITSQGYNLIQDTGGCTLTGDNTGNIVGQEPHLGPLQHNEGPTMTQALLPDSPAIDAGTCTVGTDQRGVIRPQGDTCDIGAYEFKQLALYLPMIAR
jgi:hypothetical protein